MIPQAIEESLNLIKMEHSIKARLDGSTLKFGTVDNEGNIKVMTVQELAKVLK